MTLFVTNISRTVSEEALKALFTTMGKVLSVRIMGDKYTGESKGFAFIEMGTEKEGNDAIRKLTHAEFFGRKLVVSKARPKTVAY